MSADHSKIINYLVRMVIPLRREFGQPLDVQHFLHDLDYAQEIVKKALSSQDPHLREQAEYVSKLRFGPRVGEVQPTLTAPAPSVPAAPTRTAPAANLPEGIQERRKSRRDSPPAAPTADAPAAPKQAPATPLSAEEKMKADIMKRYTSGLR